MNAKPMRIFLDTDIGPDCDDTAALAILLQRCREGRAALIGVTHCTGSRYGLACIDSICRAFGVRVPLGTCADQSFLSDGVALRYTKPVSETFPHGFPPDAPQPDALGTCIDALSKEEDGSVTMIAIGPLNNLARFLSDPVCGPLMQKKVRRIVTMAGCFDADPVFTEWNVEMDIPAARTVFEKWTGPLDACPWEAAGSVLTGACLKEYPDNPAALAYRIYCGEKMLRPSWDLATVEMALGEVSGMEWSEDGRIEIDAKGVTRFSPDKAGNRRYARLTDAEAAARALENVLRRAAETMTRQ